MSAPTPAASSIEAATALLQAELTQLEEQQEDLCAQQQSVQAQLAVVSGHIESIRGALAALHAVTSPAIRPAASAEAATRVTTRASASSEPTSATSARSTGERASAAAGREPAVIIDGAPAVGEEASDQGAPGLAAPELRGRRFTEQVIAVLARNPDAVLRARDVAEALGRDETAGSINAVRSTLDRLVATSRAHRVGRGRYQAATVRNG
ncbi:hypothetical protein [Streptomyces sp. NPDC006527]|uniref:hypothetical protein n=1 Tax=Streptomyces sp. NPDC006527 TaxID=3364749 RepID=UPI00368952B6